MIQENYNVHADVLAIKHALYKYPKNQRGKAHFDVCPNHAAFGAFAMQNSPTIPIHKYDKISSEDKSRLYGPAL
jgi:hypothetical protein